MPVRSITLRLIFGLLLVWFFHDGRVRAHFIAALSRLFIRICSGFLNLSLF